MNTPTKGSIFESISDLKNGLYVSTLNQNNSGTVSHVNTTMIPQFYDGNEINTTFTYPPTNPSNTKEESVPALSSPIQSKGNHQYIESETKKERDELQIDSLEHNTICGTVWLQNKTLSAIKKYKKRFLSLQRKKLQIFRNDLEFKPSFVIDLNNATIIPTKPKKFHVQTAKKIFKFKCVSEEQRQEWLQHLIKEKKEKNVEQIREAILSRMKSWNEEQTNILESIQSINNHKGSHSPTVNSTPIFEISSQRLVFKPLTLSGFRENNKNIQLLSFLTNEEIYCFFTKTLRDLTLVTRKQVFANNISIIIESSNKDFQAISYVDSEGEVGVVIKDGYIYPKQHIIEKLLTWEFEISEELNNISIELESILNFNEDTDGISQLSLINKISKIRFALTESDEKFDKIKVYSNIKKFLSELQELKQQDFSIFKFTIELLGKIIFSTNSVSLFTKRGDSIVENFPISDDNIFSFLITSPQVMDIIIRSKILKLDEILQNEIDKSQTVLGKRIIFSLGGDIRSRAAPRLGSTENKLSNSNEKIQLSFIQLLQRLIDEVPERYKFKAMKYIDEVVISVQSTKIQENMLVDGVNEAKGRFQFSADELKATLKEKNKERKEMANSFSYKNAASETPDTSEATGNNRDSISEHSESILEINNIEQEYDISIQDTLKKNFSKKFPLNEQEIDQIVDEALKQLRKMWQNPTNEMELQQFIHDYIELVDLDQSVADKLFQLIQDKSLNNQFEFKSIALTLLKETLPQIVHDNLSRRRDIVLFGMKQSGKTQLLYKLKLNKNIKTIPSVGIQQEVVAFHDLNLMLYDIGGQSKEKDALKFFTKQRHDKIDGLIYMIDASIYTQSKESVLSLLQLFVKNIMKINQFSIQNQGSDGKEESNPKIPLLIFLNKTDIPHAVDEEILLEYLDPALEKFYTKWNIHTKVQPCSVLRGDGLFEGLQYLYDSLVRREREKHDNI